jgi:hypothetical protein
MLEATRWQWDERLVDEALVDRHVCVDRDPFGARQWQRAAEAGEMPIELRWWLELALERQQAAGIPAWTAFTGPTSSSVTAPEHSITMACCGPASGSLRVVLGQAHDQLPADCGSRSPP